MFMKRIIALTLTIIITFCFSSCSIKDKDIEASSTTLLRSEKDIHISNANKVMKNYLNNYGKSLSDVQCKGIVELSSKKYVRYEYKEVSNYSCYVAINENYNIYGGYDGSELEFLWENMNNTSTTTTIENKNHNHTYLPGYENEPLYVEIMKYENCTDPEELCVLLENLYGEEISFYFLDYKDGTNEDHKNGYFHEPYDNYIYQIIAFYKVELDIFEPQSDTYVFWGEDSLKTRFIMDKDGSYIVSENKTNYYDDGTSGHWIKAWILSDLYLCAHGYINEDDEGKKSCKEAAYGIDVYEEFENLIISTMQ